MKLGVGLPNTLVPEVDRTLMRDWARVADQAGFEVLATIDKPNYDSWGPLSTLTFAAGVTERAKLATTIMQLPNREEHMLAKQVATTDRASGGRMIFGTALGWDPSDYEVFGAEWRGRGKRMEEQLANMRAVWQRARASSGDNPVFGPPPVQDPLPVWIGGSSEPALDRAIRLADGYVFGTAGIQRMADLTPELRERARAAGRSEFHIAGLAYGAIGGEEAYEEAAHHLVRYYGSDRILGALHHGPPDALAEAAAGYAEEAGIDTLIVFLEVADVRQVEQLAEHVLPGYRSA